MKFSYRGLCLERLELKRDKKKNTQVKQPMYTIKAVPKIIK